MPPCLLSRRLQNLSLSNFEHCFRLSKAMIALLFDTVLLQSTCSTSQPSQQKSLRRLLSQPLCRVAGHTSTQAATSRHKRKDPLTIRLSSSGSPDHSFHSANAFPDDRMCLVCGTHSSASCPVCEQDFCKNHLYVCLDCDNQCCGGCLDDHRADGHWTDSDTAVELNSGRKDKSVSAGFPIGKDGFVSTSNRTQRVCSEQAGCQSHSGNVLPADRNRPSSRLSQSGALASLIARAMRSVRPCLSSFAADMLMKLFSQSELHREVCL